MNVAVLGCGSWGTALTILLARNGHNVTLLGRSEEELYILESHRENLRYLPGFVIPRDVQFKHISTILQDIDLTVVSVPSGAVRQVVEEVQGEHPLIVVSSKGLEVGTAKPLCQVVEEVLPNAEVGVLSGPNLAMEIARGIPTIGIAAFKNQEAADKVQVAFNCATYRVSTTDDVVGIELAGALKNVLAIGAGMSDGLGFGDNTKGAFIARGLMEMAKIGTRMGAQLDTFLGPAGVGDLFATAASQLSRNYRLGRALGKGSTLQEAIASVGQVAEGVPTSEATMMLAKQLEIDIPVFAAVEGVIRAKITPKQAVAMLMERAPKMDHFLKNSNP